MTINSETWYSFTEAARLLGVTRRTMSGWFHAGKLSPESVRRSPTGRLRISGAEVLRWLGDPVNPQPITVASQTELERRIQRNRKRLAELGC